MDLTAVDKLLTTTRSVRKRLDFTRSVEPEILQQCLEIAIQAPTGGNRQGYHFVVVTDAAKRAELSAIYKRSYLEVYTPARQEETRQTDPGLIDSATFRSDDEHTLFIDRMRWRSAEDAKAGLELFEKLPTSQRFLSLMAGPPQVGGRFSLIAGE